MAYALRLLLAATRLLLVLSLRQPIGRITSLDRRKLEEGKPDAAFYATPRLVTHADDAFLRKLTTLYREKLPPGGRVLDLMSSHVSHLPRDLTLSRVDGHGMNADELSSNPAFEGGEWWVQDLNAQPALPFAADGAYDAVLCMAGVQYLEEPEAVFAECSRALAPETGVMIVSFTNSFFFQKAIYGWSERGMATRAKLVRDYMRAAGGFVDVEIVGDGTGLLAQLGSIGGLGGDPFVAVIGRRDSSTR
jgi:hypothetical protein